jgi:SNF2 family DNA or RNA helicase
VKIIENKALLLNLRNPKRITEVIPKARELPNNQVLVRWGLDEAHVLKNLKIRNVPSPILGNYKWPGKHKPYAHQTDTASFLTLHKRAFCFNEQGTGKTASVIWAADYLMTQGKIRRTLIICPLSIMDSAWVNDLFTFAMHRTVGVAYGSAAKRKQIIEGDSEFVIINYDGVEIVRDVIANAYKNAQTKRWKVLNSLMNSRMWLWMLTGTPAAQAPTDAYGLAKLVNPQGVPQFFTGFKDMVMVKVSNFTWIPKNSATKTVFEALQPAIRYTKDECLDLPEMTYIKRNVALSKAQDRYYKLIKDKMVAEIAGESISAVNAAVHMNKLLQISCGAVYTDDKDVIEFDISPRYKVLIEAIEETRNKVLVFVPFKSISRVLHEKLNADKIPAEEINGDVPVSARNDIFRRFQTTDNPRVLIIQPQAAAHGVTLTAADTVVWWGPTSSLETYAQANARVHRAGQKNKTTVIQIQGSKIEQYVYKLLDNRIDVHTKLVDLYDELLD